MQFVTRSKYCDDSTGFSCAAVDLAIFFLLFPNQSRVNVADGAVEQHREAQCVLTDQMFASGSNRGETR